LIDAVESGTQNRRTKLTGHTRAHCYAVVFEEVKVLHLRFQRTFPSFVSSRIIPRSESSFRTRSEAKVAPRPRRLAFRNQFFDFRVAQTAVAAAKTRRFQ